MHPRMDNELPDKSALSAGQKESVAKVSEKKEEQPAATVPASQYAVGFFPVDEWIQKAGQRQFASIDADYQYETLEVPESMKGRVEEWEDEDFVDEDEAASIRFRCLDVLKHAMEDAKFMEEQLELERDEFDNKIHREEQKEIFWKSIQKSFEDEVQRIIQRKSCRLIPRE